MPAEWRGAYDLVVASGVLLEGHIPPSGMEDAFEMLKPGGHFVAGFRKKYFVDGNGFGYDELINELSEAGKIKVLKTWDFMRGRPDNPDPLFREQPSFMIAC